MPLAAVDPSATVTTSSAPVSHGAARLVGGVLVIVALAAAISVDPVRWGGGVKGDEATYVAMALSVADDGDLTYERRDLERFWGIYGQGPEGIFLKAGKQIRIRLRGSPPFIRVFRQPDTKPDRLYFGKAMVYPVAVAPFVRFFGMNGFLVFHVLLLTLVSVCGYLFLAAGSRPAPALTFTLAFVGISVVPAYVVFLTPEIFNFSVVFLAYFCWAYKEVTTPRRSWLRDWRSDALAAALLGVATYSKPTHAPLIAPLVCLWWWRRRLWPGVLAGAVFTVVTLGLFGLNAMNSGEFNYQGGDRKTFYGSFPFQTGARDEWARNTLVSTTNDSDAESVLEPGELVGRFAHNVEYFLIGRHFGFVPYFFPGAIAILAWVLSRHRSDPWRVLSFLACGLGTVVLLLFLPYTWSGGGGPPGNRYFLSLYPTLFFLMPPLRSTGPGLLAWAVGALFTAKILMNPFLAAKNTWEITERGFARRLPVEVTMANDLPVMLAQPVRGRIPYRTDPMMLLYFLDRHAFPPEPAGMWIAGDGRANIVVRTEEPIHHLVVTAESPIQTVLTMSIGAGTRSVSVVPGRPVTFDLPAQGVRGLKSYAYLLAANSSESFVPRVRDPQSGDSRRLGVLVRFQAK